MRKILSCLLAFVFAVIIGFTSLPVFAGENASVSKVTKIVVAQNEPCETISENGKVQVTNDDFTPAEIVGVTNKIETALQPPAEPEIVPLL